jgi:hypothetical protein
MNHLEKYDNERGDSYLFCNTGAIWGWATWKRQWDRYDFNMSYMSTKEDFLKIKNCDYPNYYKRH